VLARFFCETAAPRLADTAYALAMTATEGRFDAGNGLLLASAGVGVVALVSIERRARHPIIAVSAFASTAFSAGLVMNVLVSAIMMATLGRPRSFCMPRIAGRVSCTKPPMS